MDPVQPSQQINVQQELPNSTAILVLGILSIITCWCWSIPGLACGIIALVLSSKSENLYRSNPGLYRPSSYSNLKAGKVCAIIGVCLSGLTFVTIFIKLLFGAAFLTFFSTLIPFLDK